eukprot:9804195-Ditylum_brightwellii.AAC.1
MEGLAMEYIDARSILNEQKSVKGKFHSFLSDDSDQGVATTAAHTENTIYMKYGIVIDCAVGAPDHGRDVVDALNAVDKRLLRRAMLRNSILEEHNN